LPYIRQEILDATVWDFVSNLIHHPRTLGLKLEETKRELDTRNQSLRDRLAQIQTIMQRQERKLNVLLDEYAETTSEEVKVLFGRLKAETEQLFNELQDEREHIEQELQANTLVENYILECERHAKEIREKLEDASFEKQREVIESLNVTGTLILEADAKVLYLHIYILHETDTSS
jgi:hypothetical protein